MVLKTSQGISKLCCCYSVKSASGSNSLSEDLMTLSCLLISIFLSTDNYLLFIYIFKEETKNTGSFGFPHIRAVTRSDNQLQLALFCYPDMWTRKTKYFDLRFFPAVYLKHVMISNIHMSPVTFTNTVLKAWILDKFSWSVWNIAQST